MAGQPEAQTRVRAQGCLLRQEEQTWARREVGCRALQRHCQHAIQFTVGDWAVLWGGVSLMMEPMSVSRQRGGYFLRHTRVRPPGLRTPASFPAQPAGFGLACTRCEGRDTTQLATRKQKNAFPTYSEGCFSACVSRARQQLKIVFLRRSKKIVCEQI